MEYFETEVIQKKMCDKYNTIKQTKLKDYLRKVLLKSDGVEQSKISIDRKWSGSLPYTFLDILSFFIGSSVLCKSFKMIYMSVVEKCMQYELKMRILSNERKCIYLSTT